ncbi:MAG: FAD-dependent monooxygenase, partial [Candidatus Dormibacteraceae bacterium]
MTAGKTALIIGGGITGPVAAIALRKAGIEATIYEAYDKRADNVGGVLFIGTNGLDALAAIDVLEATHGHGLPTPRVSIYNGGGKLLCTTPTSLPLADGITTTSFKRAELYRVLHQEAARRGIRTELGKRLTRITESTDSITAHFADGTEASADILIGADGIRSTVREIIDPAASKPRYTGLVAFAGFAPNPALPPDRDTYKMAFGKNAFFWYFVPDPRQAWWEVNMPSKEPLSREQILAEGIDTWSRRLIQLFQEDKSPAAQILGAQGEDLLCIGAQYDLPSARSWHRGR